MTLPGLSTRERSALDFIRDRTREMRIAPTYDEIAAHLGVTSKSNISRLVHQLVDKGYLLPPSQGRRSLAVTCLGGAYTVLLDGDVERRLLDLVAGTRAKPETMIAEAVAEYLERRP